MTVFVGFFLVAFASSAGAYATQSLGLPPLPTYGAIAAVVVGLLLFVQFFFTIDYVATVDALGITVTGQSVLGPLRGKLDRIVDARWADLTRIEDVTANTLTQRGRLQKNHKLVLGQVEVQSALFGTLSRDGHYLELLQAVREAVGDRLVERQDMGELGRLVDTVLEQRARDERDGR